MYIKQGKNCKYNIKGVSNSSESFDSELKLDQYLEAMLDSGIKIEDDYKHGVFAVRYDPKAAALSKIQEVINFRDNAPKETRGKHVTNVLDEDGSEIEEEIFKFIGSVGTTEFMTRFGNVSNLLEGLITPFNKESWAQWFLDNGGTAEQIKQQEDVLWPRLTEYGTEVHEVIESVISGKNYKAKDGGLTEEQIKQVRQYATNLISDLKVKHGKNCEIYTEFGFISKSLHPDVLAAMEPFGLTSINGKADLIVVDDSGNVHIYDFKVSRKSPGLFNNMSNSTIKKRDFATVEEGEWPSIKKIAAKYQMAIYSLILEQYGLNVKSTNIIPIKLDFEYKSEYEIDHLKGINTWSMSDMESSDMKQMLGLSIAEQRRNLLRRTLPTAEQTLSVEVEAVVNKYRELFPSINTGTSVQQKQATAEYMKANGKVVTLNSTHEKYPEFRYSFFAAGTSNSVIYCKDEEDLNSKLSDYVDQINAIKANELSNWAQTLNGEFGSENPDWDKIYGDFHPDDQIVIKNQLRKYYEEPGWRFRYDPSLNSFGILEFERDGDIEIVVISNSPLFSVAKLGIGTSILGETESNKNTGSREILPGTYANLALMKAMTYLSENTDKYDGKKIVQIKALNPWFGQFSDSVSNSELISNFEALRLRNPKVGLNKVSTAMFYSDFESAIQLVLSKAMELEIDKKMIDFDEKYDACKVQDVETWVISTMDYLKYKYPELRRENSQRGSKAWEAYSLLNEMLYRIGGFKTYNEMDQTPWLKGTTLGTYITSPQFSSSKNIQEFARIHDRYVAEVRVKVQQQGFEMQTLFRELYESEGHGAQAFNSWFRKDAEGKIAKGFMLVDPDSADFRGSEVSKKVLRKYLETMCKIQHPEATTPADIEILKNTGAYYRVPLTEAVFSRQVQGIGLFKAVKKRWDKAMELTEDIFAGDADIKAEYERRNDKLYNKFALTEQQRQDKIEEHGVGFFETKLELVFNQVLVAYNKQQVSEKYVPIFKAMQIGLKRLDEDGGNDLKNVRETIDKLIENRFYGRNIMGDLQGVYKYLRAISKFFSLAKLALNVKSFLREMMTGAYIGASRTMAKQPGEVTMENYNKAVAYIVQDLPQNLTGISMLQQMNAIYGMANYSLSNVANQRKVDWLNINNWSQNTLFLGCSAPDYQHRMALLIAKMMDDGCWEAHSLDGNGQIKYDFSKDGRFSVYLSGNTSNSKYKEQRALYLKNIEEWNTQGYRKADGSYLEEGDELPLPYTNRESQSIKNYADILYGHYDDESRSLMNDMFLGSFIMQFKTFFTAKLEQWVMKGGTYNVEYLKQQYDPVTGEKLYEIIRYPNPDNTGMPYRDIVKESNLVSLTEEEQTQVRPYFEWTGQPMEGMGRGFIRFVKAMKAMDKEKLAQIWNDPHERGLLLLGLNDTLLMGLLFVLIKALFGAAVGSEEWDDINQDVRKNYFISLGYNVLTGFARDNNFGSVISSMAGDINPPFLTSLTQLVHSSGSVIMGNQSLMYALTRNVGALSDFSGIVKEWDKIRNTVE